MNDQQHAQIDYNSLKMRCNICDKTGCDLVVNGFCFVDLDNNGICEQCYIRLNESNLAKKFRVEWIDKPRLPEIDIYE